MMRARSVTWFALSTVLIPSIIGSVDGYYVSFQSRCFQTRLTKTLLHETTSSDNNNNNSPTDLPEIGDDTKRLFLVRHGEVINPGGDRAVFYGCMDVPLSPLGEAEARAAGEFLQQYPLELVASSPLSRAIYGAKQVIAKQAALPTNEDLLLLDGFKELDRGAWCGLTKEEIGLDNLARFDACDESITPKDGESYLFLKDRVLSARDQVLEKVSPGKSAAIVSHLQVTRSILSEALGMPMDKMAELAVGTASITCIDYNSSDGSQTVSFQSYKPDIGLAGSIDEAN